VGKHGSRPSREQLFVRLAECGGLRERHLRQRLVRPGPSAVDHSGGRTKKLVGLGASPLESSGCYHLSLRCDQDPRHP
jgi:hypothetical protein